MSSGLTEMNRDLFLPSIQKFYSLDAIGTSMARRQPI